MRSTCKHKTSIAFEEYTTPSEKKKTNYLTIFERNGERLKDVYLVPSEVFWFGYQKQLWP